jgi:hypothetical protein
MDGLFMKFDEIFGKFGENPGFIEIWQEKRVLSMKVYAQLRNISRNTSQNEKCSRQNLWRKFTHTFCVKLFFSKIVLLMK